MRNDSLERIKKEFLAITGIVPLHVTNRLEDGYILRSVIFNGLAERIFDHPRLLDVLTIKIEHWLGQEEGEFTYALAGYVYYIKEDFARAEKYFLKAINANPLNLDNWFDLAFSLYHQGLRRHNLAKRILFNFDYCVGHFQDKKVTIRILEAALQDL